MVNFKQCNRPITEYIENIPKFYLILGRFSIYSSVEWFHSNNEQSILCYWRKIVFNDTTHDPYSKESLVRRDLILGISEEDGCEIFDISIDVVYEQSRKNPDVHLM